MQRQWKPSYWPLHGHCLTRLRWCGQRSKTSRLSHTWPTVTVFFWGREPSFNSRSFSTWKIFTSNSCGGIFSCFSSYTLRRFKHFAPGDLIFSNNLFGIQMKVRDSLNWDYLANVVREASLRHQLEGAYMTPVCRRSTLILWRSLSHLLSHLHRSHTRYTTEAPERVLYPPAPPGCYQPFCVIRPVIDMTT